MLIHRKRKLREEFHVTKGQSKSKDLLAQQSHSVANLASTNAGGIIQQW